MIFVELTSSIRFAVVTSGLNGEWVELTLTNKGKGKKRELKLNDIILSQ